MFTFRAPGRRVGGHHAVELPADDHGRVPRAGAGHRQRDGLQAAAEHAARLPARSASCSPRRAFPKGLVSILPGDGDARRAARHASGGRRDRLRRLVGDRPSGSSAPPGLKRSIMEVSGNGPLVVLADADLERAAAGRRLRRLLERRPGLLRDRAGARRAGRPRRLHGGARGASQAAVLGDPFDAATTLGPLNNEPTAAKMDRHVADAVDRGATLVRGGARAADQPTSLYYEFTVARRRHRPTCSSPARSPSARSSPSSPPHTDVELLRIANADPPRPPGRRVHPLAPASLLLRREPPAAAPSSSTTPPTTSRPPSPSGAPPAPGPAGAASAGCPSCGT